MSKQQEAKPMSKDEYNTKKLNASSFPYEVDYNDHFETPIEAYQDILPLLDLVAPTTTTTTITTTKQPKRSKHILYDPYYCDGKAATLLHTLGFTNVQHEKCDFYEKIRNNDVPFHHTLVTNPPYSGDHKEKCVEYAVKGLRGRDDVFFLLMPNYIALKEYFRVAIADEEGKEPKDIVYVIPPSSYEYDHPEGTGHDIPPFASIWFCGLGTAASEKAKVIFNRLNQNNFKTGNDTKRPPSVLVSTLEELKQRNAVPNQKRLNPRQRRKQKQRLQQQNFSSSMDHNNGAAAYSPPESCKKDSIVTTQPQNNCKLQKKKKRKRQKGENASGGGGGGEKSPNLTTTTKDDAKLKNKSIYRDSNGVRKKRRF